MPSTNRPALWINFIKFVLTNQEGYVVDVFPENEDLIGTDLSRHDFCIEVSKIAKPSGHPYSFLLRITSP